MGYSHYWRVPFGEIDLNTWKLLCKDMEKLVAESGIPVHHSVEFNEEWMDCSGPDINNEYILFTPNDNVEAFSLDRITVRDKYETEEDELHFNCCKTRMRKCDKLITAALMLCHHHLGDNFKISSDGWNEDFDEGRDLLFHVFRGEPDITFKFTSAEEET